MNKPPSVWVFNDGRAGTFNQALGIAELLDIPFEIKELKYGRLAKLPNFLRFASKIGIDHCSIRQIQDDINKNGYPDMIISAGRRAAPFARYIRKKSGGKTKLVQIMSAGHFGLKDFSLIVIPYHDNNTLTNTNIMKIIGAPHRITQEKLRHYASLWQDKFKDLPRPFTALIVGGSTKNRTFTNEMAEDLTARVNKLLGESERGTVFITTSRRTGKEPENIIINGIDEPRYVYRWSDKGENPYFAFLALADRIIVTGDSVSMCSESCSTPVPVYIYDDEGLITLKHRRFLDKLYQEGYANPLKFEPADDEAPHLTLNPSADIAKRVKELLE